MGKLRASALARMPEPHTLQSVSQEPKHIACSTVRATPRHGPLLRDSAGEEEQERREKGEQEEAKTEEEEEGVKKGETEWEEEGGKGGGGKGRGMDGLEGEEQGCSLPLPRPRSQGHQSSRTSATTVSRMW